jgi:hypothetical protein
MKINLMLILASSGIFLSSMALACGDSGCGGSYSGCNTYDTSDWNSQYGYGCEKSCDCVCTDDGWRYNDCLSRGAYCYAFGNIGAR